MSTLLELHDAVAAELLALRRRVAELEQAALKKDEIQAQQARANRRLEALMDESGESIVVHRDGRILFANRAFQRLTDASGPAAVAGRHLWDDFHLPAAEPDSLDGADPSGNGSAGPRVFPWKNAKGEERYLLAKCGGVEWEGSPALRSAFLDVTESRGSRARIESELARLRDFLEVSSGWTWETGSDHRFIHVSSGYSDLLGEPVDALLGKQPWDFGAQYPESAEQGRTLRELLDAHEGFHDSVHAFRGPQGTTRLISLRAKAVTDPAAGFLGFRGTARDVSAEMQARLQASREHQRLVDAIEAIPAGFYLYDSDERFVLANRRAHEMFPEYQEMYVPGRSFHDLIRFAYEKRLTKDASHQGEDWIANWEARVKNPPDSFEYQRHDGRWIRMIDRRTSDGGRVSIRFDCTEEKEREAELSRIRESFRATMTASELPMLVHRNFKPLFANQAFANLFGYDSPEEVLALPDIMVTIPPHHREAAAAKHAARMAGFSVPGRYEREAVRRDRSLLWVDAFATIVEWRGEAALLVAFVDISERRSIEAALRVSESRLRHLFERFPLAVLVHRELKPLFANRVYAEMMGLSSVDEVLALADIAGTANPEDLAMIRGNYRKLVSENSEPIQLERVAIRRDGTRFWVHVMVTAVHWEGETAVLVAYVDITQRKLAEENLRHSEERFRRLFEENVFAMLVHRNRVPIYVNPAFARLFGYGNPAEVLDLETVYAVVDPSEHDRMNAYAEQRLRGGSAPNQFMFRGRRKDGSSPWVLNTATTLDWEGEPAILSTMQDVTELKQAEEDRNTSEQRFRDFAEVASDWFWETGPDHRFTYVSGRIDDVLGLEESHFLGKTRWELTPFAEVDWDAHRADLEARRPLRDFTFSPPDSQGSRRSVRVNGKPIFGENGEFLGYRGTGTDISAEMAARKEAERSHDQLSAAIESMPATFALYDADGRLVLMNSKLTETFKGFAHCYVIGRTYHEIIQCAAASGALEQMRGREEAWIAERMETFRDPPESRDVPLGGGRWLRSLDRRTQDGGTVSIRWDITELKKREDALRTSEERFRGLVEGSIQGIIVHRDFKPVFANRAFLELFGFSTLEEVLALDLNEMPYIAPRERERVLSYAKARLRGDPAPSRYRFEGLRRDGSPVWADIAVSIVRWDGEPAVLATYTDISDYMRAEQARQISEEKFRNLVEGSIQGVLIHGNFRPLYANDALARILGYASVDEILSLPSAMAVVAPEERARVQEMGRRRLLGENVPERYEFVALRKDGGRIWVEIYSRRIEWEGGPAVQTVFFDVTERVRAEEDLRSSRELLQIVFDALPVWISMKDREGRFLMVNRKSQEDTGISAEEFKRMRTEDQPYLAEETLEKVREDERHVLAGESTDSEYAVNLSRNRRRVHHTVKVPFHGKNGEVVGIVTVGEDITERKTLEDQLRQAQKMEAIGQLAGGVAHDFNNLLQIISGYTQFVLREVQDHPEIRSDLEQVIEAADRGSQLTRQLLAFGRRQLLQRAPLNLNDSINNLAKLLRRLFEENIEIVSVSGSNLAPVHADSGMIEQVLLNLCLNARDAMPNGGVLTISAGNAVLDREFCDRNPGAEPGRHVWVRVADTGEGISPDYMSRIFEPFFTTKELGKGTGLGLAMAYGIVHQHEGLILVQSQPGEGATFTIYLPAAGLAGRADSENEDRPELPGGQETILVAEDEPRVRDMAQRVLRGAGYSVLVASDGKEALDMFQAHADRIDLILLDVIMPGPDGKVVYEQVRLQSPTLPVLFCSGYSGGSISEHLVEDMPVNLLQKPFKTEELLFMVRELLDRAALMER